ncbi:unnamed protein product [Rotaria magnacalcarata]|uniref:PIPK domain-containing protein n=1 Tax=Rotaria magnacalcarata TaxID=392030 RepID=A0A819LN48_9BILA|nr:unnamed protein product [Rotaria magnacalcarata]CAF1593470.1 unnamed protein product [Rotaria magnacalcarata]CAF2121727.1 unnamed protein product [Rotaria magnacalcarata]CAF2146324.1 unnamed protein product [Rotaria magnacalcarata]CAF2266481.1 unnamed protein product [Rotaria magnacalcarata]
MAYLLESIDKNKHVTSNNAQIDSTKITEGLYGTDLWNPFDSRFASYVKSSIQLHCVTSKTSLIGRVLRQAIVNLVYRITREPDEHIENDTTVIGTEHRIYHSYRYKYESKTDKVLGTTLNEDADADGDIEFEISALAPTVFYKLREDLGISNIDFRQSFSKHRMKDFTNPGRSGSLMYKTFDDLYILKSLYEHEARLFMQILAGYHLQLTQRPTIFNRIVGLYSIRFGTLISNIEIYVAVMLNAFTPSLRINEIFDLKGSKINRQLEGTLSLDKLHKLKDLDFVNLYPHGIRIPSNIYQRLHRVISNDARVLRKLNITDYSLILGITHIDVSQDNLMQCRPSAGISALCHTVNTIALLCKHEKNSERLISNTQIYLKDVPISLLKPLEMLHEKIDEDLFFNDDAIARSTLPIPGIINKSDQRVYLYFAIIDMLQEYDTRKSLEQKLKQMTNPNHQSQGSVIEPDEYEKRFLNFIFQSVFIDAGDDFSWARTGTS